MKKLNKLGYIAIGMVLAFIIGMATPVFAASKDVIKQLTAYFTSGGKPITVYVNSTKVTKDSTGKAVTPFAVDGTTYLPVRAISDALGKDIAWDGATASVKITDKTTAASTPSPAPDAAKDAYTALYARYDWNGKPIELWANHYKVDKDAAGKAITPFTIGDDVYVPLKTVADVLGYNYEDHGDKVFVKHYDFTKPGDKAAPNATLTAIKNDKGEWNDSLDYKFTLDKDAVGEWKIWDLCTNLDDFAPLMPAPLSSLWWNGISIYSDGTALEHTLMADKSIIDNDRKWTSGHYIYPADKNGNYTAPAYSINTVNGKTFMFVESKMGDYERTGKVPGYFVFVKTSDTPAPAPKTTK